MPRERKVAVLFANLKGNIGDFAILQAILEQLNFYYPGYKIDVYSHPLVDIDETRLAAFSKHSPPFSLISSSHSS